MDDRRDIGDSEQSIVFIGKGEQSVAPEVNSSAGDILTGSMSTRTRARHSTRFHILRNLNLTRS